MRARPPPQGREPLSTSGFFSNAALRKTVAVMSLLELSQKEVSNSSPGRQTKTQTKVDTKRTTHHFPLNRCHINWKT